MPTGVEAACYSGNLWHAIAPLFDGSPGSITIWGWRVNPPWERGVAWDDLDPTERCHTRTGHRVPTRTRRLSRDSPIRPRCRGSRHVWCTTSCPRMESPARREPHDVGVHPRRRTRLHHR